MKLAVRALVALVALAVAVAAAEAVARLADPFGTSYYRETNRYLNEAVRFPADGARRDGRLIENAPHAALRLRDFDFFTDAAGLRAPEPGLPPPPPAGADDRLRVLCVGDSVTLGWGVDDAETWVRALGRRGRTPDGRGVLAMNAGHLQFNTVQEADWLAAHGPALAPDVVVLTFLVNDFDDNWSKYVALTAAPATGPTPGQRLRAAFARWLPGLEGLVQHRRERAAAAAQGEAYEGVDVTTLPEYREGWARCRAALDRVAETCAALGARLVVLDHTTPTVPELAGWGAERGVPVYPFAFTDAELARGLAVSAADAHANPLGNALLAEKALAALAAEGLLAPADR